MDIQEKISRINWQREPEGLYAPIAYTMAAGGKRIRPQLAMIACQLFGGNPEEVAPAAMALEVFHNFTLLHDDVMDHAEVRRGRPTVHIQWDENTAILSGDQMLIEAYKLLAEVPAFVLPEVLQMFNKMATEVCEGQQYDVDFEKQDQVPIADYLKMIRLKTAVLLATALKMGAYIAGADTQAQDALYQFGINIGLAFQIQDDILDVWGDPTTFGKAVGGDISCNKKTFVLLTAMQMANDVQRHELSDWLEQVLDDNAEKITCVTNIYNQIGVREACNKVVEEYTQQALNILDNLPQNAATDELRNLAKKLYNRNQ
ncbi:MAG: polyprenyl synthetase family protein [Paludibacteraceae bacterium]|nr:polyprenyl synthetase family protein [Paludibacteraceae bacterium]